MKQIGLLAILFAVLLAAVVSKELSRPEAGALRDQVPLVPLGTRAFTVADVAASDVAGPGGADAFTLRRDGDRWLVEGAFRAPAATGTVERLVEELSTARGELRLEDAAKLSKFDLSDDRAATVAVRDAQGALLSRVAIGRSSGTQGAFVRLLHEGADDDRAYAVTKDVRAALGLPRTRSADDAPQAPRAAHFHDLDLPPLAVDGATRVEITSPLWTLAFEKAGAEWAPAAGVPADLAIKPAAVRDIVQPSSGNLTASAPVDPARRAELGLGEGAYRVAVILADGSRRAAVGAADHGAQTFHLRLDVAQDPDVVYEASRWSFERRFPPGSKLFDFKTLDVADEGLVRIEIASERGALAMERPSGRAPDDWTLLEPRWALAPRQQQLRDITALLRGVRPIDLTTGDVAFEPWATVRWTRRDAETAQELRIGQAAPGGAGRLAILPDDPERTVVIAETTVDRIVPDPVELHERRPLHGVLSEDVTVLAVRAAGGDELFRVARAADGAWNLAEGGRERRADSLAVSDWLDRLLLLEVDGLADEPVTATHEVVVERKNGLPVVIGAARGAADARIVIGGVTFDATEADLAPEASSLAGAPAGGGDTQDGAEDDGDDTLDDGVQDDGTDGE